MDFLLNFLVICGLCAVGSAFIVLLPVVGQTVAAVWVTDTWVTRAQANSSSRVPHQLPITKSTGEPWASPRGP